MIGMFLVYVFCRIDTNTTFILSVILVNVCEEEEMKLLVIINVDAAHSVKQHILLGWLSRGGVSP